jgi:hypothetical protein
MGLRRRWYAVSGVLILASFLLLAFRGLNFGIDFTGGVVLDSGDAAFAAVLEAQAQRKVQVFGDAFQGISFDRYDHASKWVHAPPPARDDGLAWCGGPCYPLLRGFIAALGRVGRALQADGAARTAKLAKWLLASASDKQAASSPQLNELQPSAVDPGMVAVQPLRLRVIAVYGATTARVMRPVFMKGQSRVVPGWCVLGRPVDSTEEERRAVKLRQAAARAAAVTASHELHGGGGVGESSSNDEYGAAADEGVHHAPKKARTSSAAAAPTSSAATPGGDVALPQRDPYPRHACSVF